MVNLSSSTLLRLHGLYACKEKYFPVWRASEILKFVQAGILVKNALIGCGMNFLVPFLNRSSYLDISVTVVIVITFIVVGRNR